MSAPLAIEIRIWQQLLEAHPELAEDEDLRLNTMEGETRIHELLAGILRGAKVKEAKAKGMADLITDMQSRKAALLFGAVTIRTAALHAMTEVGLRKIEAPDFTASTREGSVPLIESADADVTKLSDELCKIKREPDKKAIRAAIESGVVVPGYSLGNKPTTLAIRS